MGPTQLMLCLLSAVFVKSSMRQFQYFGEQLHRTDAYKFCQNQSMTLVTLYDEDDAKSVGNLATGIIPAIWVGLEKKFNNGNDHPMCPSTSENQNCSTKLFFQCERGDIVNVRLNWCAAKQYCQYHSLGDLKSSVNSKADEPLWIGGNIIDNWAWDDGGCSIYRKWDGNRNTNSVVSMGLNETLKTLPDFAVVPVMCSKGDVRIVVIKEPKTWEQALDHCDKHHSGLLQILTEEHQAAVEQWLNDKRYNGTYWVGLRQSRVFGFWIWKDRVVNSSNWENDEAPEMPLSHQCGVIHVPTYKWKDHNCLFPLPFLCEERIVRLG